MKAADDEPDILARLAAGDQSALRWMSDCHAAAVWRIAYRMLGDAGDAEDVAQEAFLRLWSHAARLKGGEAGAVAWLRRIAVNLCFDRLRRRRFASADEVPDQIDQEPLADRRLEAQEAGQAVKQCLERLPDRQRAAIVLTYYEDQPNQAAAQALDVHLKAMESLLFRARSSLKGCLERKGVVEKY